MTNVGTAHIENFADGQAGIARAKFELVAALPANGVAFLNCDDPYVSQFGRDFQGRAVYFGAGPCADPQLLEAERGPGGSCTSSFAPGSARAELTLHLLGAHNASNAMAGLGRRAGGGRRTGCRGGRARIAHRRRQARPGDGDRRRHDSERQLQLQSRGAALDDPHPGRASRRAAGFWWPARCWRWASTAPRCTPPADAPPPRPGWTWWSGCRATPNTWPPPPARAGSPRCFCPMPKPPASWLKQNLQAGDVVLVKGSRGVHLERAIEAVQNSPNDMRTFP